MKKRNQKNLAIAVDIGATNFRTAIVDDKGRIIKKILTKTVRQGNNFAISKQITRETNLLLKDQSKANILGLGVSIAGPIDFKRGGSINPPNLYFNCIPIVDPLKKVFSFPVVLYNDCNVGVLAEKFFGEGKKISNVVYITMSTGVGGGVFMDGRLLLGKDGNAAEVGHITVDTQYNLTCTCKKGRGHWEAYASGRNIPKFFKAWTKGKNLDFRKLNSAKDIFEEAKSGDKICLWFIEDLGKINGRGISNVIAAYDPELIVLGGSVVLNNKQLILKPALKNVDKFLRQPKIKVSILGEDAPLLGAAASVFYNEDRFTSEEMRILPSYKVW
ncbi:MAG: ROK family protein [Parcubacteria group bacterium]|jgi:glucokinase